jgi:hypothetical protein
MKGGSGGGEDTSTVVRCGSGGQGGINVSHLDAGRALPRSSVWLCCWQRGGRGGANGAAPSWAVGSHTTSPTVPSPLLPPPFRTPHPQTIKSHAVVLYMKGTPQQPMCGFSSQVVRILNQHGASFPFVFGGGVGSMVSRSFILTSVSPTHYHYLLCVQASRSTA